MPRASPSARPVPPPYEPLGRRWRNCLQSCRDVLHLSLQRADRARWMSRPVWRGFRVFSCGWYAEAHGHTWKRHDLNEGVFIYCTAGKGVYSAEGRRWPVGRGDLLYCPPLSRHAYAADARDPWSIYWMHVSGPELPACVQMLGLGPDRPVIAVGIRPRAIAAFRALFHFMQSPLTDSRMLALASNARLALACLALESGEDTTSESIGAGIQRVIDHMEAHIAEPAPTGAWRALFGGSRSHFHRQFRRATGRTPGDYFMRLKVRKAAGLLATSRQRVAEISEAVGVGDPYYFSRLFRRIMGVSPRGYREGHASPEFASSPTP